MIPRLLLVLLFLVRPSSVVGIEGVPSPEQVAKRQTIVDLLDEVRSLQVERGRLRAELRRARQSIDPDAVQIRVLDSGIRSLDHAIAGLGESALDLTLDVFGLTPVGDRRILDDSDFHGQPAPFRVQFSNSRTHRAFNPKTGKLEVSHFEKSTVMGISWEDGTITITEQALRSPGILAATLVHEIVHYNQRTLPHGVSRNAMEREVSAFGSVLSNETILKLGLTAEDVKILKAFQADFMANPEGYLPQSGLPTNQMAGIGSIEDLGPLGEFAVDREAIARVNEESSALRRSIEIQAHARSQEFLARIDAGASELSAAFRSKEASNCNLMAVNAEADQFRVRVGRGQPLNLRYADADGFFVAVLLAQACSLPSQLSPCNDGMEIVRRRWDEKDFRDSVMLAVGSDKVISDCFWHLNDKLKAKDDFETLRAKAKRFRETREAASPNPLPAPPSQTAPPPEREPRPVPRPDIPHCRHMGAWCDGTNDPH